MQNLKDEGDGGLDARQFATVVVPHFQPIYNLREGHVVGFEALARVETGGRLLQPAQFLPLLDSDGLLRLFTAMLTKSIELFKTIEHRQHRLTIAINVSASVVLREEFVDVVRFVVADLAFEADRLVIEILEGEAITDMRLMVETIHRLHALGIEVALDDVGSAYASLSNIKDLPVDILKLDHGFARLLSSRPEDLQFITSVIGLARGLDRKLIVEGAETADIVEALRFIGIDYAQGFALARPMPGPAVRDWLISSDLKPADPVPRSLLGVYAAHLTITEACRVLGNQPFELRWHEDAVDPHQCVIGQYLDRHGLHDATEYGRAHKHFHRSLGRASESGKAEWGEAAEDLRQALLDALKAGIEEARAEAPVCQTTPLYRKVG